MVRHHAVGLGLTTTSRGVARTDTIGLTVDRGDAMGEGGEIGDGVALDAEEMQTGAPWQDLVETIDDGDQRSEEHTSELQSLMRISYAVFCSTQKIDTV